MRKIERVFLAGPDRLTREAHAIARRQERLCREAGFTAVLAPAAEPPDELRGELQARALYAETAARLRSADAVVANLTPWRGPGCDPATAFLAGFASALGKPVFAYLNVGGEDEAAFRDRVEMVIGAEPDGEGRWRDPDGGEIEDLGLPEVALLWAEARRFVVIVTSEPLEDLTGLEMSLEGVRLYAD